MHRDIVVTAASGYTYNQVKHWLNSLDRCGFGGERLVLVGNGDPGLVGSLEARGCQVVTRATLVDPWPDAAAEPPAFSDRDICVERFFLLWKYLTARPLHDIRYVICVDVRDAVFQLNPSMWLEAHLHGKQLVVSSEGLTFGDEAWNRQSMADAFGPSVFEHMRDRLVWNCGTIAGEASVIRDLSLQLYLCSRTITYADQASLNVLLSLDPYQRLTLFDRGDVGWACEGATMSRFARGAELSYKHRGLEPLFDGDMVYTADGTPFCIVHQYDRVPAWKVRLEKKFG